jgi:hypothetical protein
MTARPEAVIAVFGDLLAALGIDVDVARATAELGQLLEDPWAGYCHNPLQHRSALTESGAPFELSLKLGGDGSLSLRYVVDVGDPAVDLVGNAERYLDAARLITGQSDEVLRRLFDCHLGDALAGTRATVMHGVGWMSAGRRRSTLYFPAGWLAPDALAQRLPEPMEIPGRAQVVGYDFDADGLASWKTYHWLRVDPTRPLAERLDLGRLPNAARVIHDRFAADVPEGARETSTFLQWRRDVNAVHGRLFFFALPWGWGSTRSMADLLALLRSFDLDLRPLRAVADCMRRHGLSVHVGLVSVGGCDITSVTFYFWPT